MVTTIWTPVLLTLVSILIWQRVESAETSWVAPPFNGSNTGYRFSTSPDASNGYPRKNALLEGFTRQEFQAINCTLISLTPVRDTLEHLLLSGAKLVEIDLQLLGYPHDLLDHRLKEVFQPYHWVRTNGRPGRSLLILGDNYDFMSLTFLSIGVFNMNANLVDSPQGCLESLDAGDTMAVIRELLLNNFKIPDVKTDESLSSDNHVCSMRVQDSRGYAVFAYSCCHRNSDGDTICEDMNRDVWIKVLVVFVWVTKIVVVLFSPLFLPGFLYSRKYVASEYIYHFSAEAPVKSIRVVVTKIPKMYGSAQKVVSMAAIKDMSHFKSLATNDLLLDKIYELKLDHARLSVMVRRLLGEYDVPVGLLTLLYNNLVRCRIRYLTPIQDCCNTSILGGMAADTTVPKWYKCGQIVAKAIIILILLSPWALRMILFYAYEEDKMAEKNRVVHRLGLELPFNGNFTSYLSPLHGFFIAIYVICVLFSLIHGIFSTAMSERFTLVFHQCLRDVHASSGTAVCAWITRILVVPFRKFGLVGFLFFVPYTCVSLIVIVPMATFCVFPALNLSVRLIVHFFIFIAPVKMRNVCRRFSEYFAKIQGDKEVNKTKADETCKWGRQLGHCEQILQVAVIFLCLLSFWSVTFLLMEVVSFFVEMGVYTLMGIIVNAGSTLQYITVLFLVLMYGKSAFSGVRKTYLTYHKKIHDLLLSMKREEVNKIAPQSLHEQENAALRVQGNMACQSHESDIRLIVKGGQPVWHTSSMLLFLDRNDTPHTPEKFFYDTITLDYYGAPGSLYVNFVSAFWSFGKILIFLVFVFIVVMALGDAYSVSSTNRLLATVFGGFVPFLFRFVFITESGTPSLNTESVQFTTQLHSAINHYKQNWPVADIDPTQVIEVESQGKEVLKEKVGDNEPSHTTIYTNRMSAASSASSDLELHEDTGDKSGLDLIIDVSTKDTKHSDSQDANETMSMPMMGAESFSRSTGSVFIHMSPKPNPDRVTNV